MSVPTSAPSSRPRALLGALSFAACSALASGLLLSGCGGDRAPDYGICRASLLWGGWEGTPQCAGTAMNVIQPEDRACRTDADCGLVAVNRCAAHAVNRPAVTRYASLPMPCTAPFGGLCMPVTFRPQCQQGCCVAASTAAIPGLPGR